MLGSNEKMSFIMEYLAAYREKINMANKYGLFDAAKMYELFGIEVCKLWFGQDFTNLNVETPTYPYVDLISEDKKLYVQVSTAQDIPRKIKTTLENIRDSKDGRYSELNKVMFFVLRNDSIDKVVDYSGDGQIGKISFTKKDNLITTQNIIDKADNDTAFLNNLYNVIRLEFERYNESAENLKEAIEFSKSVGLKNIPCLINNEYEIDRSKLVKSIKEDDAKFVTILGNAGSGKSALCKKIVEDEDIVLHARAERFLEETDINKIWKCDVKAVLEYLNGKRIIFFIDALEFISDCSDTKFELLQYLYVIVNNYKNAYILTSCRTGDQSTFIRLKSYFMVKHYEIDDLTIDELILIMQKYPIIRKMHEMKSYSDLLKSPFYINMIVSRSLNIDDINDENSFREYIWRNIICLQEKNKIYKIAYKDASEAITKIVFERAKRFSLGIPEEDIDSRIVKALISEDIIIRQWRDNIRLKYDIYEDICFEHYFDREFAECRGEYQAFYDKIETLERCVYRRYQIWISNKLFAESNRNIFLYNLIFSNNIPQKWKQQTEIGIVKSKYCNKFFEKYAMDILDSEILMEFVKIINLFAFDAKIVFNKEVPQICLQPIGNGRPCLIRIIESEHIYKKDIIKKNDVIKLCSDYTRQNTRENQTVLSACTILEYYIEIAKEIEKDYKFIDAAKTCLEVVYQMADVSNEWIRNFLILLSDDYKSNNRRNKRMAEDTIQWTLINTYPILVKEMAKELCSLVDVFWLNRREDDIDDDYLDRLNKEKKYGLSKNCEQHDYTYTSVYQNNFLWNLFSVNFKIGFQWAIRFVNETVNRYATNYPNEVIRIKVQFVEEQLPREYWGNTNMWMAGIVENSVPVLIGDLIFCLKNVIIQKLEGCKQSEYFVTFANQIKDYLYLNSNNIALLAIIESIGMHFERELPGYLLDLITSMEIIHWDISRFILYEEDPTIGLLKKQIFMSVGVPNISRRYALDNKCSISIQQYFSNVQDCLEPEMQKKCRRIADYLQDITKNDTENSIDYLQIQKADFLDDSIKASNSSVDTEAKEIAQEQEGKVALMRLSEGIIKKCSNGVSDDKANLKLILSTIKEIFDIMNASVLPVQYEDVLVKLIVLALQNHELSAQNRSMLCKFWTAKLHKIFSNEPFIYEISTFSILLNQLNSDISLDTKNDIKELMIKCLIYNGQDGIIDQMTYYVKNYLQGNKCLARSIFNTVIKLAEDEMNHQRYNADYLKMSGINKNFVFLPNMQPKLSWVEQYMESAGKQSYNSHKEEILTRYLFGEEELQIAEFDISNYDISTLCYAANCGLNFDNEFFGKVIHGVLTGMVDIWKYHERDNDSRKIIDTFQEQELVELYQREMIQASGDAKVVIDTLFNGMDFSKFTSEAVEFYKDIFGNFLPEFFAAYVDPKRRDRCKKKLSYIEQKVESINMEYVRLQLYQSLMLSVTRYCYGDWSKFRTSYSFRDKQFLNEQFSKYGKYFVGKLLETVYQLHIDELLPEILVSIRNSFRDAKAESSKFARDIQEQKSIVNMVILKSFVQYSDMIKNNQELTIAYQDILELLIDLNYEEAAVILDEFRVH